MADLPTSADLLAFAVSFVPGYLSLNVASFIVKGKTLDLPWLEKVILSYVWSLLIFLTVFTPLGITLNASTIANSLTTVSALLILATSIGFGLIAAALFYVALRLFDILPRDMGNLLERVGLGWLTARFTGYYFEPASARFLRDLYANSNRNEVVIESQSGRTFRGTLVYLSTEPTLDVVLFGEPFMRELVGSKWETLEEYSILFPEGSIRTVRAIGRAPAQ